MMNVLVGAAALLALVVQGHQQAEQLKGSAYGKLFTLVTPTAVQGKGVDPAGVPQRGACNMPMIAGNTQVDPKIVKPIEKANTDPKIRAIEPPVCWEK
jgi:hypothetical protein